MKKVILGLLLMSNATFAQDTTKFSSTYQLNGLISGGNSNRKLISTNETFAYNKGKTTLSTNLNFTYGSNNKILLEREYFQTISYGHYLSERYKIIVFGDIENSNLRLISFRSSLGEGIYYKVVNQKNILLDISEAFLMEKTEFRNNDSLNLYSARLSTRIRFNAKLGTFSISLVSLVQPSIKQMFLNDGDKYINNKDNFLSRSTLTLEQSLYKNLSFAVTCNYIVETYSKFLNRQIADYNIQFGLKYTTK